MFFNFAFVANNQLKLVPKLVPNDVEVKHWLCNPMISNSIPGNLKVVYLDENSLTPTKTNSNRVKEFVS